MVIIMTNNSARREIIAVVDDLMFRSKIQAAALELSIDVTYPKNEEELKETLAAKPTSLIIFDLGARSQDVLSIIKLIKTNEKTRSTLVISFFPHVNEELKRKAVEAGCDMVVPRSRFSLKLKDILLNYANTAT